jgi:tetratricopeptide (TPR) repeat protein
MRYTADTTSNIFYIITAAASILVLVGWRSFREIRDNIESITSTKLAELTQEYEQRLEEIESSMKIRSEQIIKNQEEISRTNQIHSIWMRAGLEKNEREKISLYDQILELNPDDVEAIAYKADVLLDTGEKKWALSLADQAIDKDPEYSFAYWQRACSKAELGLFDDAVDDIEIAIRLSESLRDHLATEKSFDGLRGNERFDALIASLPVTRDEDPS